MWGRSAFCCTALVLLCVVGGAKGDCNYTNSFALSGLSPGSTQKQELFAITANCTNVSVDQAFPLYARSAVVADQSQTLTSKGVTVGLTMAFLDNGLSSDPMNISRTVVADCVSSAGVLCRTELTLQLLVISSKTSAWQAPQGFAPAGCALAGNLQVTVRFAKGNATGLYKPLQASWKLGTALPWLASRPSKASVQDGTSGTSYKADDQKVLTQIAPGTDDGTLALTLDLPKPAAKSSTWTICIIPGDGYNYYDELCSAAFAVYGSASDCPAAPTASNTRGSAKLEQAISIAAIGSMLLGLHSSVV